MPSGGLTRERSGAIAALAVVTAAVVGALATGPEVGSINGGVESLSAASGSWLGRLGGALPIGYAFGAGMVAAVNPCGFALLPAYIALYLGSAEGAPSRVDLLPRFGQAIAVSVVMTLGFILVFGVAGLILSAVSAALVQYLPWLGLCVGVLLAVMGGRMLAGAMVYTSLGEQIAGRLGGRAQERGPRGYFAYGLAYAAASLSCVLPIFLGVVAGAMAAGGIVAATIQFVLYALGMGTVIAILTVSSAFLKLGAVARARRLVRHVEPASAVLLLLAGGYIVYYWLTLGGILTTLGLAVR